MKNAILLTTMIVALPLCTLGIDATNTSFSAEDLASHLRVRHNTFTFEHHGTASEIAYCILIYKDGKVVQRGTGISDSTSQVRQKLQRFAVVYTDDGDAISFTVLNNGRSNHFKVHKPDGIGTFQIVTPGAQFDEKGQLVLAYNVKPEEDGHIRMTDKNSTAEGASEALVFQIEIQ